MRKLGVLLLVVCLAPIAFGQASSSGTVGGDIPFTYIFSCNWDGTATSALSSVNSSHYNQGYIDITGLLISASVQANDLCQIAVKIGSWTVPAAYDASGPKRDVTSNTDFNFQITGIAPAEDMSVVNSFGSYQEVTSTDQACLLADDASGVSTTTFAGDARVDLSWPMM